ncbi:beta-2-glycoprotein 1-like isoform X2 [Rhinatrema bivittatum]|uniref:beta-2-glycoprotein 1-like isoform X2 n=1 Tax=Rhinatrema bivittatum TaxID=194408 RepID=UPI001128048C|nr:beta-2-glycoprotein 1-like isoform X2 [Rhinatrema bivittatum]
MGREVQLLPALVPFFLQVIAVSASRQAPPCLLAREGLAEAMGQSCQKSCLRDRDCSGKRRCLCDGNCGMSCVTPSRTCPWPVQLDHAETRLPAETHHFGDQMEVSCRPGFQMPDGWNSAMSRCQGDRKWSTTAPCQAELDAENTCGPPPVPANGFHVGFSWQPGSSVQYICKERYQLEGKSVNLCLENLQWSDPAPTCREVFCPPPGEIENGHLVAVERTQYKVSEVIYYLCKRSFFLDGPNRVTCQRNGSWSETPACRAQCKIPVQRSRVVYQGKKLWIGEVPEGQVQHLHTVAFFCRNQNQSCSYQAVSRCFDGELALPDCYNEPTWLQYTLFPKKVVSEIRSC